MEVDSWPPINNNSDVRERGCLIIQPSISVKKNHTALLNIFDTLFCLWLLIATSKHDHRHQHFCSERAWEEYLKSKHDLTSKFYIPLSLIIKSDIRKVIRFLTEYHLRKYAEDGNNHCRASFQEIWLTEHLILITIWKFVHSFIHSKFQIIYFSEYTQNKNC